MTPDSISRLVASVYLQLVMSSVTDETDNLTTLDEISDRHDGGDTLLRPSTEGTAERRGVHLSMLSCGCHSGMSPAFFSHDNSMSVGCQQAG